MSRTSGALALSAFVLALAVGPARADLDAGAYRAEDPAAARAAMDAAIAELLRGLHPRVREVYEAQLRRTVAPYATFRAEPREGALVVFLEARELALPLDGSARVVAGPEGRRVRASQRREGEALVVVLAADQGTREDRFHPEGRGALRSEVLFRSPLLPRPLAYEYRLVSE